MNARVLRAADYRRMRWKNGGGWTTQLAAAPDAEAATFDWRISIAEVERDGAFSTFAGCDRYIALLDGIGMELQFEAMPSIRLDQRLKFARFPGETSCSGRLLAAPVRDFNIIVRREAVVADVLHRPLVGPMVFLPEASVSWFVYVAAGRALLKESDDGELATGDSLLIGGGEPHNRVLSGGGEVVLIKLTRRAET